MDRGARDRVRDHPQCRMARWRGRSQGLGSPPSRYGPRSASRWPGPSSWPTSATQLRAAHEARSRASHRSSSPLHGIPGRPHRAPEPPIGPWRRVENPAPSCAGSIGSPAGSKRFRSRACRNRGHPSAPAGHGSQADSARSMEFLGDRIGLEWCSIGPGNGPIGLESGGTIVPQLRRANRNNGPPGIDGIGTQLRRANRN